MSALLVTKRDIVRAEFGERIEIPGRQYMPYVAVLGIVGAFVTNAPIVALSFVLLAGHSILPTETKAVQLNPKLRRMHILLSEDAGDEVTLDDLVQDATAINRPLAESVMSFIFDNACRDRDNDWVVNWKGQEVLICDFFTGAFKSQNAQKSETLIPDEPKPTAAIGSSTRLGAIEAAVVAPAPIAPAPLPTVAPTAVVTEATAAKSDKQLADEFKETWFPKWRSVLLHESPEGLRFGINAATELWEGTNPGCDRAQFLKLIELLLSSTQGAVIKDGFFYPNPKKPAESFHGTEVVPQNKPAESIRALIVAELSKGDRDAKELVESFGDRKIEAYNELKTMKTDKAIAGKNGKIHLVQQSGQR